MGSYQDLIYDLTPAGEAALKDHGLWSGFVNPHSGPWTHRYMVSAITSSIELAATADPKLSYIPQEAILERADTSLRYPVPFKNPVTGKMETSNLIPDAIFGLEYKQANGGKYRFFIVEADRATEPSRSSRFNRKSHLRNFLQYREYIGQGLYKKHLKLSAGIMVLTVTTNDHTMENMIKLVEETSKRGNSYLLFQTCENFGRYFKPPKPMQELFTGKWKRAGLPEFDLGRD